MPFKISTVASFYSLNQRNIIDCLKGKIFETKSVFDLFAKCNVIFNRLKYLTKCDFDSCFLDSDIKYSIIDL